jgi:hypothetical protein
MEQETSVRRGTIVLIALGFVLLTLVVVLGILLLSNMGFGRTYQEQLGMAERYVAEGDYDAAILVYQDAIEQDKDNSEAYVALAELLIDQNRMDEAREIIELGLFRIDSPRLEYLMKRYFVDQSGEKQDDTEPEGIKSGGTLMEETIEEPSSDVEVEGVSGKVIDATTGQAVANAKLDFREGRRVVGLIDATAMTDRKGVYSLPLEDGEYRVTISKSGYTTETFELHVSGGTPDSAQFTISATLGVGEIRIVLEWGARPPDLDSYLTGRLDDGTVVSTSFSHRQSLNRNNELVADLDVDDRNGFGPETTTIYQTAGTFEFRVEDFGRTGGLSTSGAQVKVYLGNGAPVVIDVPAGLRNDWLVCRIDHGVVTVVNTAS